LKDDVRKSIQRLAAHISTGRRTRCAIRLTLDAVQFLSVLHMLSTRWQIKSSEEPLEDKRSVFDPIAAYSAARRHAVRRTRSRECSIAYPLSRRPAITTTPRRASGRNFAFAFLCSLRQFRNEQHSAINEYGWHTRQPPGPVSGSLAFAGQSLWIFGMMSG
jgi:hypothetical protein